MKLTFKKKMMKVKKDDEYGNEKIKKNQNDYVLEALKMPKSKVRC